MIFDDLMNRESAAQTKNQRTNEQDGNHKSENKPSY